jgi:hypothetical protein
MSRFKSTSMLIGAALLASVGFSNAARADVVTYQLTFENAAGNSIGSGVLTLNNVTTSSTMLVGPSGTPSDFVSLTGSITDTAIEHGTSTTNFSIGSAAFPGIFFNSSVLHAAGITLTNGQVAGFAAPGSSDVFTSDGNIFQFIGNGDAARDTPGLDFALGSNQGLGQILGTIVVGSPVVAAVPEPSTWAMMMLGFAGLAFMTVRRRKMSAAA